MKTLVKTACIASFFLLTACEPEVGSEAWCEKLKEKPKGEWTLDEGKEYTKSCLFK